MIKRFFVFKAFDKNSSWSFGAIIINPSTILVINTNMNVKKDLGIPLNILSDSEAYQRNL